MLLKELNKLTDAECAALLFDWNVWARDAQLLPQGDWWSTWLILAGRGFGKTRTGAESVRLLQENGYGRIALVAPTAADARDVMVEGESGILAISPPWDRPVYTPSKRKLEWPNGALAFTYSADEPERLRGPQHDAAWCDELCSWRYPEARDMLAFGLRLGQRPIEIITTTPKPIRLLKEIMQDENTVMTTGSTYDNRENLAPTFFKKVVGKYEGTRLGRQELHAAVLDDNPNALWKRMWIDDHRVAKGEVPDLVRIGVAIDPAVSNNEDSAETGIVIGGKTRDGHAYILADRSGRFNPLAWAKKAISAFDEFKGDRVIGEVNNGGDLIEANLRSVDETIPYRQVRATRGKAVRAEPIASLYEQGRVHHVGTFGEMEDQMCDWNPNDKNALSPDRMDALVWLLTWLFEDEEPTSNLRVL